MNAMSRTKGNAGESEVAGMVRDLTGFDVSRRVRQHDGDGDLKGVPGWSIEVKRHAGAGRADIARWWAQCTAQAGALRPVLFYRLDCDSWRAIWPLGMHLAAAWCEYPMTVEGSVAARAAVATSLTGKPPPHPSRS
jgi:hypothetical protein